MFKVIFIFLASCCIGLSQKSLDAHRISGKISIDGELNEWEWKNTQATSGFVQNQPKPGIAPTFDTEVKVLYDNEAIYIGAFMMDNEANKILKELVIRDQEGNADRFGVGFDTYRDGINAFVFVVSASGVQFDSKYSSSGDDDTWDAVWESKVKIVENGWTAEIKLPYSALRFPNVDVQNWNIQFFRDIRRIREESYWNEVKPEQDGFVNQFGILENLSNIKSPIRLSVNPYVTSYLNTNHTPGQSNSLTTNTSYAAGMDLKYGLNDAFTLDMTLIPDFGQVISDKNVLNLSPFEVYFEENRQFFTEGLELFNKGNLFYTRRVGSRPIHFYDVYEMTNEGEVVAENPTSTRLINATKISGRMSSGLGLGFFNGLAKDAFAIIKSIDGSERRIETSPLTNYNVVVLDQSLSNNSFITLMNTNVSRKGKDYDANATGLFTKFRDKKQMYELVFDGFLSNKYGAPEVKDGFKTFLSLGKVSGAWTYDIYHNLESSHFDINDLGFLFSPNENTFGIDAAYNQYQPKNEKIITYKYEFSTYYSRLQQPNYFTDYANELSAFVLFKSRFAFGLDSRLEPIETRDYFEPRTSDFSKYLAFPINYTFGGFISSDYRKTLAIDAKLHYRWFDSDNRSTITIGAFPRVRVNNHFSFSGGSSIQFINSEPGYVNKNNIGRDIFGVTNDDIMMGIRHRLDVDNSISGNYIFNDLMGATIRLRHYWSNVQYKSFGTLQPDGNLKAISFNGKDDLGNDIFDTNFNVFTIDLQYRWRFAPGSDLFFVWKNNIFNQNKDTENSYFKNVKELWQVNQDNSLSIRAIYYLDYQKVFG